MGATIQLYRAMPLAPLHTLQQHGYNIRGHLRTDPLTDRDIRRCRICAAALQPPDRGIGAEGPIQRGASPRVDRGYARGFAAGGAFGRRLRYSLRWFVNRLRRLNSSLTSSDWLDAIPIVTPERIPPLCTHLTRCRFCLSTDCRCRNHQTCSPSTSSIFGFASSPASFDGR